MSPRSLARRASFRTLVLALFVLGCDPPAERAFVTPTNAASRSGLLAAGPGVLLGNEAGSVLLIDRAGDVVWRAVLGREISVRPAVALDTVVAGSIAGEWAGLSFADGKERWRLADRPPPAAALVAQESLVYALGTDGEVRALEAASGAVRWSRPLRAAPSPKAPLTSAPAPLIVDDALVVGTDGQVVALETTEGRVRWRHELPRPLGLASSEGLLFALGAAGTLVALQVDDGKVAWTRELGEASGGPSLAAGSLWVGLKDSSLVELEAARGRERWRMRLPAPLRSGVAEAHGLVLVPTSGQEGKLLALRPGQPKSVFELRVDSPLRAQPVVLGEMLVFAAADGRVLGYRVRPPK